MATETSSSGRPDTIDLRRRLEAVVAAIHQDKDLTSRYTTCEEDASRIKCFALLQEARGHIYTVQAFPAVDCELSSSARSLPEIVYHRVFEDAIEKYTGSRSKPNPVLRATRSGDFCSVATLKVEAVPAGSADSASSTPRLVREYQILDHLWKAFRAQLKVRRDADDELVGIPMPLELSVCGGGGGEFRLPRGPLVDKFGRQRPQPAAWAAASVSFLASEQLGPSVQYLQQLLRSQRRGVSVASGLKIFDQLLCRLLSLHRRGVVLGDLDPGHLRFGRGRAADVLYASKFDCALVLSAPGARAPPFAGRRFSSKRAAQQRPGHVVQDLEAAFYVLQQLLAGRLPWDASSSAKDSYDVADCKCRFWQTDELFRASLEGVFADSEDLGRRVLAEIFERTRAVVACSSSEEAAAGHFAQRVANAYTGVRQAAMSFFRFPALRREPEQPQAGADTRAAWSTSDWCWSDLELRLIDDSG